MARFETQKPRIPGTPGTSCDGARGSSGRRLRRSAAAVGIGILACAPAWAAKNSFQEVTEKWRATRARDASLEVRLRPLAASDSLFRVDSTATPQHLGAEMRRLWNGIQYLLSDELRGQFLGLSSDELRQEWLRRYWIFRDPTPTTAKNERREVHEDRVTQARARFASKDAVGWDDRGAIWIQFGEPDSIIEEAASVEDGRGFVPAHQEWLYVPEKWVVEFERPNPRRGWVIGRSSARVSYRPDLVARDRARLGYDPRLEPPTIESRERASDIIGFTEERAIVAEDPLNENLDKNVLQHELRTDFYAKDLLRKKQDGLMRFRKQYSAGGERFSVPGVAPDPLWYVFDVDVFRGPPGRMRVEVHYQVNMQDLGFTWKDSLYVATYRAEGVLYDATAREASRDEYTETIDTPEFRSTMSARLIPGQLVFNVPEGNYRLGIRILDLGSKDESTYVTALEVPRLDGSALALSDVQMASSIIYAGDDWRSRFVKKDRLVIPNPMKAYPRGKQLVGYYEIYGLELDAKQVCHFEVKYTIAPRSVERREEAAPEGGYKQPFVSSSFSDEGGTADLVQELRVDVGALASDTYELVLTVRDLLSGAETSSRTSFSILN